MTIPHPDGPDFRPEALAVLIRHPRFDEAMMGGARRVIDQHRESWVLNRILSDRGRLIAAFMALDLYFADNSGRGFSLARLRDEAAHHGFASRGRITAWAASLRLLGLLAIGRAGRPHRLVPTAKFVAIFRTRMLHAWQSVAVVYPAASWAIAALEWDEFFAEVPAGFMGPYRAGRRVFHAVPELASIADREAGMILLISVLLKNAAGERISIANLAREFAVPRAHVRAILQAAEALDLVVRVDPDGVYRALPGLAAAIRRFFAAVFQAHIFAMERALARLGGEVAAPLAVVSAE